MIPFKQIALTLVLGGAIKVWQSGEEITATDLNANFTHIHSKMVGGHGARLVNADVSNSAGICTTGTCAKIENGHGVAKAFAEVHCFWTGASCTVISSMNVSSVARAGQGVYNVTLAYTAADTHYTVVVSSPIDNPDGGTFDLGVTCFPVATTSTTVFQIECRKIDTPALRYDAFFNVAVYDNN